MRKAQCAAKMVKIGSKDLLYFHLLKNFKSINMSAEDWKGIVKVIRKDIDDVKQASKEAQAAIIAESQRELRPTRVTPPHLLKLLFEDDESG